MKDYIIVGLGLAGLAVSKELLNKEKSFVVYEDFSQQASLVAGGIYNPIILKRFTLAWQAVKQLPIALDFYDSLERDLDFSFRKNLDIYRRFASIEEQNNWFAASDKPKLSNYLDTELVRQVNPHIKSQFSFGRVKNTGIVDTSMLLNSYHHYLADLGFFQNEKFDYNLLEINESGVIYKGVEARAIVFCEGFSLKQNPFFNYLPLSGNKGEYLIIKAEQLKLEVMVKSSVFIIPMGDDLYKVGASYKHGDKSSSPTQQTKQELLHELGQLISCEYEVVGQEAGIRPATSDRRPLVGRHPQHRSLFVCNGFGSRGILIAPTAAQELVSFMEKDGDLDPEMDVARFTKKYYKG